MKYYIEFKNLHNLFPISIRNLILFENMKKSKNQIININVFSYIDEVKISKYNIMTIIASWLWLLLITHYYW